MKIKTLKAYRDKETGANIKVDQERDVSAKRGKEIIAAGYAVEIKPEKDE